MLHICVSYLTPNKDDCTTNQESKYSRNTNHVAYRENQGNSIKKIQHNFRTIRDYYKMSFKLLKMDLQRDVDILFEQHNELAHYVDNITDTLNYNLKVYEHNENQIINWIDGVILFTIFWVFLAMYVMQWEIEKELKKITAEVKTFTKQQKKCLNV